jgi:hypothetical protein
MGRQEGRRRDQREYNVNDLDVSFDDYAFGFDWVEAHAAHSPLSVARREVRVM